MWINVNVSATTHIALRREGEVQMESDVGDLIVGLMMAVFGLIVFGISLSVFAVCFDFGLMKQHFDRRDATLVVRRIAEERILVHV
jgi:hypothetical protein